MNHRNLNKGKLGETLAADYLSHKGYRIIFRNFKIRYGEIDLIATHKNCLIFIEVKTRLSSTYGTPEDAITSWKLKSLVRAIQYFKLLHPELPEALQIDMVAVELDYNEKLTRIQHYSNISG